MNSKVFCDEIIGLVTGASATGKDFHMVTLDDERQEEQSLKRRVAQIKVERSSLDSQLSQLEGELAVVEDGARAREASNINNALSLLKIHFSEFADNRSKVEQAQEEIDRLRDLVEKTSELCMRESTEAKAWKEKYRQLAKSKGAAPPPAAAAGSDSVEAASPPPPHQSQPLPIQAFGIDCVSTGSAHLPGALVTAVHASSAVSSQLTPGDIIVEAAGRTVAAPEDLRSVPHTALHSDMDVTVLRRKSEVLKISSAAKPAARATRLRFTRNVTSAEHAAPAPAHDTSDEKPRRSTLTNASPPAGAKDLINVHRGSVHVAPPPDLRTSDLRNESPEVEAVEAQPAAPVAPAPAAAAAASPTPPAAKPVIPLLSLPAAAPSKHTTHHAKVPRKVTKAAHGAHKK